MLSHGLLARLKAQPGQIGETEQFLQSALPLVQAEPDTAVWFALRFGRGECGIFGAFDSEPGRHAHLSGAVATALMTRWPQLLEKAPDIARVDVLASKMPPEHPGERGPAVSCGLLLSFRAREGKAEQVEQFLRDGLAYARDEPGTIAWFALRWPERRYGIFDVFPDHGARFAHLTGHVPRELAKHAFTLLGGMPSMDMVDVMATHVASASTVVGLA